MCQQILTHDYVDYQKAMLEELMSQYVDVDNKDFWDDSVSNLF